MYNGEQKNNYFEIKSDDLFPLQDKVLSGFIVTSSSEFDYKYFDEEEKYEKIP